MDTLEDLNRQCQSLYTKTWRAKNPEYVKKMDNLRSERLNLNRAIPKLEVKLEKYKKRLPKVEQELKKNSRYRILGQLRKRKLEECET
jgi:predicted nuclease with TOPRIM domain